MFCGNFRASAQQNACKWPRKQHLRCKNAHENTGEDIPLRRHYKLKRAVVALHLRDKRVTRRCFAPLRDNALYSLDRHHIGVSVTHITFGT